MLLENKNAVIYGAAGAVGSAVAQAFAREGARLFLTGRDLGALDVLARRAQPPAARSRPPRSTRSTRRP
jgi:NAD(P)-dependent dehydrogenase (short-subunit alcohol dehydrogenase family)